MTRRLYPFNELSHNTVVSHAQQQSFCLVYGMNSSELEVNGWTVCTLVHGMPPRSVPAELTE